MAGQGKDGGAGDGDEIRGHDRAANRLSPSLSAWRDTRM
jgi:hypothetical protein